MVFNIRTEIDRVPALNTDLGAVHWQATLGLSLVLILLIGILLWSGPEQPNSKKAEIPLAKCLRRGNVEKIAFGKDERVVLQRDPKNSADQTSEAWFLGGLEEFRVRAEPLQSAKLLLEELSFEEVALPTDVKDLDGVGLKEPAASLSITCAGKSWRLKLGRESQYFGSRYALLEGSLGVYNLPRALYDLSQKGFSDFIDVGAALGIPLQFSPDQVDLLEFSFGVGGGVTLVKNAAGWQVNGQEGDPIFVGQLLRNLAELRPIGVARISVQALFQNPAVKVKVRAIGGEVATLAISQPYKSRNLVDPIYFAVGRNAAQPFIIDAKSFLRIRPREEALLKSTSIQVE